MHQFSSVQLLSHVQLFATPWTTAHQASLSITNCSSLLKLMTIESVMPSNHLILCCPLLLLPSIFPSIRVFSNELAFSNQVAKVLEFQLQHQSFQWTPKAKCTLIVSSTLSKSTMQQFSLWWMLFFCLPNFHFIFYKKFITVRETFVPLWVQGS